MRRFYKKAVFIVDSKPVKVCQPARGNRNTMGKTCPEKAPDFGYCAAQALYYFEDRKPFHKPFAKGRKRLETSFSQFTDQFNIMRNYAKDYRGIFTRIISKMSAFTVSQYINKINDKSIGRIKYALA